MKLKCRKQRSCAKLSSLNFHAYIPTRNKLISSMLSSCIIAIVKHDSSWGKNNIHNHFRMEIQFKQQCIIMLKLYEKFRNLTAKIIGIMYY